MNSYGDNFFSQIFLSVLSVDIYCTLTQQSVAQVKELRRKQQMKHQAEYEHKLVSEKQLIKSWRGGHMKEEIGDEVRILMGFPITVIL
jgi:hypothetical protein